ncbi:hypothetical protein CDAR_297201 [Caerostris darwini]|uniref:Uncharacterized protein n=1 Tax=Caerostris darwini TaxID=1538125 RepID=A0AAV4PRU1_9ARAC|nr:hypothetical protein CDAR_297201 [Caerostris darwini]
MTRILRGLASVEVITYHTLTSRTSIVTFCRALWERGKKLKDPWIAHPLGPTGKVSQQEKQFSLGTWIADSGDNVIISFSISQLDRHLDTRPTVVDALTPFSSLAIGGINGEVKMCS